MLRGEALREFDFIASQVARTTNGHLKHIKVGLLSYPPPPPQRAQQSEARHEARNEETSRSPVQDIFSTTNVIK